MSAALEMATPSTLPARVASARAGVDRGITGTTLEFTAPIPGDMQTLLNQFGDDRTIESRIMGLE